MFSLRRWLDGFHRRCNFLNFLAVHRLSSSLKNLCPMTSSVDSRDLEGRGPVPRRAEPSMPLNNAPVVIIDVTVLRADVFGLELFDLLRALQVCRPRSVSQQLVSQKRKTSNLTIRYCVQRDCHGLVGSRGGEWSHFDSQGLQASSRKASELVSSCSMATVVRLLGAVCPDLRLLPLRSLWCFQSWSMRRGIQGWVLQRLDDWLLRGLFRAPCLFG